LLAEIMTSARF